MTGSRAVMAAVVAIAGGALAAPAAAAAPALPLGEYGLAPADVGGPSPRAVPGRAARAYARSLPRAARRTARGRMRQQAFRSRRGAFVGLVARTVAPSRAGASRGLASALLRASSARMDAAALGVRPRSLRAAVRRTWSAAGAAGVITVAGVRGAPGRALAAALADSARRRALAARRRTAWERATAGLRPGRPVPLRVALQAFALTVAPLPGVRVPPGTRPGPVSTSPAKFWALRARPRMSARLRTAVDRAVGRLSPTGVAPGARAAARVAAPTWKPDPAWRAIAEQIAAQYAQPGRLGPLGLKIEVGRDKIAVGDADTGVYDAGGVAQDPFALCHITLAPSFFKVSMSIRRQALAHEVAHCYQGHFQGAVKYWGGGPKDWVVEGGANWAACQVVPSKSIGPGIAGWNAQYLSSPSAPLPTLTYDGVGFFDQAARQAGIPAVWQRWPAVMTNVADDPAYDALVGAQANAVVQTWPSSFLQDSKRGPAWAAGGPCMPPDRQAPGGTAVLPKGGQYVDFVDAWTNSIVRLVVPADLLQVETDSTARISDRKGVDRIVGSGEWFCTRRKPCVCPRGEEGSPPPSTRLDGSGSAWIATNGGRGSTRTTTLLGRSLDDYCRQRRRPTRPSDRGGHSNGDPHLATFDQHYYDFQTTGEYVLARSPAGGFEIQARQQQYRGSRLVTVNTALAFRAGGRRITMTPGIVPVVRVDGRRVTGQVALGGGARIQASFTQTTVLWPDGSRADVHTAGHWGLVVNVRPSIALRGRLSGLLGNWNGDENDDLRPRGARRALRNPGFATLYGSFARSWRITRKRDSLFDYPRGKGPLSYFRHGIPARPYELRHLSAAARRAAAARCRGAGVRDPRLLEECTLDLAVTGRYEFATGAAALERDIKAPPPLGIPWARISVDRVPFSVDQEATGVDGAGRPYVGFAERQPSGRSRLVATTFSSTTEAPVSSPDRRVLAEGWLGIGSPVGYTGADGSPGLVSTELIGAGPSPLEDAGAVWTRAADGSWGPPAPALPTSNSDVAALSGPGVVPIFAQGVTGSGQIKLSRGINKAQARFDGYDGTGYVTGVALGRDGAGRVWLAYRVVVSGAIDGVWMRQIDPATAQPIGASVRAPGSEGGGDLVEGRAALACAASCRVAYRRADGKAILTWAPGEASPALASAADDAREIRAAYRGDGRLWLAWREDPGIRVVLGDARGAGASRIFTRATGDPVGRLQIQPVGANLLLLSSSASGFLGDDPHLYAANVPAP